jgi:hypothetical protein
MSANTISSTVARNLNWSTTGNDPTRSDGRPAAHARLLPPPKHGISFLPARPVNQSCNHNRRMPAPRSRRHTRTVQVKSP